VAGAEVDGDLTNFLGRVKPASMDKISLIASMLYAFCSLAYAGPERYSGKEIKQVAPPPPCPTWTGFYVGAFGGYKFGSTGVDLSLGGDWNFRPEDRNVVQAHSPENLDASGAEAGGLLGYNYQFPNNWVVSLEADGGYLWLRNSDESGVFHTSTTGDFNIKTSFKTHYLVTIGPRIGYAFGRWLPYVTGGLAIGDLDLFQRIRGLTYFFEEGGKQIETNVGWMIGGGLEYALTAHWSMRAQYQYVDLGEIDFDHGLGFGGVSNFIGNSEANLREHNASIAIIYKF
jgi:outer membrane immunogenic protein